MSNSTSSSKGSSPPPPSKSSSTPSESDSPPSPPKSNSPPPSPPSSNSPPPGSKDTHSPPLPNSPPPPDDDNSPPPPPPPPPSDDDNSPPPPPKSNSPPPPSQPPPPPPQSTPPPPNNQAPPIPNLSPPPNDPPPPTNEVQPSPSPDSPPSSGSSTTFRTPPRRDSPSNPSTPRGSTPNTDSPKQQSPSSNSSSANTGLTISLVVAGVILVLILILCMVLILTRKRKRPTLDYRAPTTILVQADGNYYRPANQMGFSGQSDSYISQGHSGPASGISGGSNSYGYSGQMEPGGGKSWFNYEELMEVTSGFSRENMIGEGGFGCVYKGTLADGRRVAVKNLKAGSGQGEREFRAEVEIISRVHHRHLVSLVGYCIAEDHRLLVYEFLSNNTLEHHLHGTPVMDWPKRMRIAIGSAKGLAYLHEDCHPRIIHRDIKSANILLEDSFEPQVADFGLAKLSNDTHTHVSTRVMGTFGYMAPEYASSGKLTDRSDVFSFGVVLLEIITGRKPVDTSRPLGDESLVEWARPLLVRALETGNCDDLVDPRLEGNYNKAEMFNMIEAAAACVRHSAPRRPRMVQVLRALDSQDDMPDLSNGVKYGQSQAFNPGPPTADIQRFRRMAFGSSENNSSFDSEEYDRRSAAAFSGEFRSREHRPARQPANQSSGDFESDTRAMFQAEKSTGGGNYRRGFT